MKNETPHSRREWGVRLFAIAVIVIAVAMVVFPPPVSWVEHFYALPRDERNAVARKIDAGPRADLAASDARARLSARPTFDRVRAIGGKAIGVVTRTPAGTHNYSLVVRLILGLPFDGKPGAS